MPGTNLPATMRGIFCLGCIPAPRLWVGAEKFTGASHVWPFACRAGCLRMEQSMQLIKVTMILASALECTACRDGQATRSARSDSRAAPVLRQAL